MNFPRRTSPIALLAAATMAFGCSSDPASPTPDASTADVAPADAAADVAQDAPVDRPARPPLPMCTAATDLSSMRPGSDGAIHVTATNADSELDRFGDYADACFSGGAVGQLMLYSYTMRAAGSLRVSTANAGTASATFDTFVAVLGACIPTAHSLTCNDNTTEPGTAALHARHSTATTGTLAAGQRVYIVVGGRGNTPATAQTGAFELTVRENAAGAENGPCRYAGDACEAGLQCSALAPGPESEGVCKRPVAVGSMCVAGDLCIRGSTCIASAADNTRGTCVGDGANGGVCLVGRTPCNTGFSCTVAIPAPDATGLCRPTLMANAECDVAQVNGVCGAGTSCRPAPTSSNPARALCFAQGTAGGLCRTGSSRCDTGLTCSSAATPTCRAEVALGAECDLTGNANYCATGSSCAPDAMFAGGRCVADGTAAGSTCRTTGPMCDAGLNCQAFNGRNVCQGTAGDMAACDWRYGSVTCPTGATCLPGGLTAGVCAAPFPETEPNNTPATAQGPFLQSSIVRGAITAGDVDCMRVRVPMNASLFVETNDNAGGCPGSGADTVVTVYNPAGTRIAENDDISSSVLCSRINGLQSGALNRLAAGDYAVCVRSYSATAAIASYYLQIAVVASP